MWMARSVFLAPLMLMLVLVGCGSGNDATEQSLTKAQFVKRADEICSRADKQQEDQLEAYLKKNPTDGASKSGQEAAIRAAGLPPIAAEAKEIANLAAPAGDEAEIEKIVAGIEGALREAEEDPFSMTKTTGGPFEKVDKLAAAYGFKACSEAL